MTTPLPPTSQGQSVGHIPDGSYEKAIFKGDIKLNPKLGDENWQTWSEAMELLLASKMLWDKVDGTTPCPDISTRPMDHKAWNYDDTQARASVYMNCEPTQLIYLRGTTTSCDAWEALQKVHGTKHQGRINLLMMKFRNFKAKDNECVDKVAAELKNLQLLIREINEAEAPTTRALAISLMSVVDEEKYRMAIFHLKLESNLTLELALESLKSVEQLSKDKEGAGRLDIAQREGEKENKRCFHCQRTGHAKPFCYDWLDNTPEGRAYAVKNPNPRRPSAGRNISQKDTRKGNKGSGRPAK